MAHDFLEQWLLGMRMKDVVGLMDVSLSGGMLKGERVMEFFRRNFVDRPIEELRNAWCLAADPVLAPHAAVSLAIDG